MLDPLTLDQMRVLVAVAETGSFSAAARRLQRVQSAISQSVQAMESTLRLTLFDRSGKTPRPNEAGLAIIEEARRVLAGAQGLRARAEALIGGLEPQLTIAVDYFFPRGPGAIVLRELGATFPDLPLTLLTEGAAAARRHLEEGTADLAIFPFEMAGGPDLDAEFLVDIEMVPVVAANHALAGHRGPLTREDLAPHVQLLLVDGAPGSSWTRGVLGQRLWRFVSLDTRMNFLLAGFGWCYMPTAMTDPALAEGRLVRLNIPQLNGFHIALHLVRRRGHHPGVAARWAMARLREALCIPAPTGSSPS